MTEPDKKLSVRAKRVIIYYRSGMQVSGQFLAIAGFL